MEPYELCKFLIDRKRYNHETMKRKANVFFANDGLSDEEYSDLLTIMSKQKTKEVEPPEETQAEA